MERHRKREKANVLVVSVHVAVKAILYRGALHLLLSDRMLLVIIQGGHVQQLPAPSMPCTCHNSRHLLQENSNKTGPINSTYPTYP